MNIWKGLFGSLIGGLTEAELQAFVHEQSAIQREGAEFYNITQSIGRLHNLDPARLTIRRDKAGRRFIEFEIEKLTTLNDGNWAQKGLFG